MTQVGTDTNPLRVAIIGSGPSGFYAAEYLQKQKDLNVAIDMYDRLPTPFGLVRGGVAPDHQKIKSVTKVYERIAGKPGFRFYGNVTFGQDLTHGDLVAHYHAIIYAVGAQTDKKLGIPGEDLPGSHAATEFVGWYNAHPDYRELTFNLNAERVAVIGIGNVAMDVTRILARTTNELMQTDIADYALEALKHSQVKEIYVLGRRGPAQAAFTNPEIKELGEMEDADIVVLPRDVDLDELSREYLTSDEVDKKDVRNVEILREYAKRDPGGKSRRIVMRFLTSPVEIIGTDQVEGIRIVRNELYRDDRGRMRPRATEESEVLPVDLVFRSVGYLGVPLPDVPFYDRWGIIPNDHGRVTTAHESGQQVIGDYAVGWIKRGPSGIIGTNKPDAVETVKLLLEDLEAGNILSPTHSDPQAIENLMRDRQVRYTTFADWQRLDQLEQQRGEEVGRPRLKYSTVDEMLDALKDADPAGD